MQNFRRTFTWPGTRAGGFGSRAVDGYLLNAGLPHTPPSVTIWQTKVHRFACARVRKGHSQADILFSQVDTDYTTGISSHAIVREQSTWLRVQRLNCDLKTISDGSLTVELESWMETDTFNNNGRRE
ncbi:hypothetical protein GN956_G24583 [Arapaima gigas]